MEITGNSSEETEEVEEEEELIVTVFLSRFLSPYVGSPDLISGHSIYMALLSKDAVNPDTVFKVSHGVFHELAWGIGSAFLGLGMKVSKYSTKPYENDGGAIGSIPTHYRRQRYGFNDKIKGYQGFCAMRDFFYPFGEGCTVKERGVADPVVMGSTEMALSDGSKVRALCPGYMSFYVIGKEPGSVDMISLGAHRNDGLGVVEIVDRFSFPLSEMEFHPKLKMADQIKDIAILGVMGSGQHKKYGYGEFRVLESRGKTYISLITPYCISDRLSSPIPSFMVPQDFRLKDEAIWRDGERISIKCIDRGQVFECAR